MWRGERTYAGEKSEGMRVDVMGTFGAKKARGDGGESAPALGRDKGTH